MYFEVILKLSNFNWIPGLFLIGYHGLLLILLPLYFLHATPSSSLILVSALLMYITGLSVTAGYHRLYSHTTYKINPVIEAVLLFFATMATQGSALRWSFDHRHHHAFVDTDRDPYSIKKGFWYAHFFWLFEKPKPIENKVIADLVKRPLLRFQHRFYGTLMVVSNVLVTFLIGYFFQDYFGAFVFAWLLRTFFLHHFTWFINSLAHTWGARTFCEELSAVDNYVIALLTFGEGYHNYHHTFAYDYRNGIRWYHFDPTKWLIWTLSKLGLASSLKKNSRQFIEEKLILAKKEQLLEKIQHSLEDYTESWKEKIEELSSQVIEKLQELKQLKTLYLSLKASQGKEKGRIKEIRSQMKAIQKHLKIQWRYWLILTRRVNALSPLPQNVQPAPLKDF